MNEKFSKTGYVLAMAGSAIGLGNAWKFPTMTGNHGGFAFIFLYLVLTILIAAAAFLAEASIGKMGAKGTIKDTSSALVNLAPNNDKRFAFGGFFMLGALLISSFYLLVIGWILYYAFLSILGLPADNENASKVFGELTSNSLLSNLLCYFVVFIITFYTVARGIKNGIEKLNFILMPSLFILLIAMLSYCAIYTPNFSAALNFIFMPDFGKILEAELILQAMGLALFSLSIGVCTVATYGASLGDETNLFKSLFYIISLNIIVGILMGLVVFSFVPVEPGVSASEGSGLIFISLASLFGSLGVAGQVLGFCFFLSLLFAGITSAVSMIEPSVSFLMDKKHYSRTGAVTFIGIFVLLLGFFCAMSFYAPSAQLFSIFGKSFFDILDYATSNIIMPLGALFFSIFTGWIVPKEKLYGLFLGYAPKFIVDIWYFILRFVLPIIIVGIGIYKLN